MQTSNEKLSVEQELSQRILKIIVNDPTKLLDGVERAKTKYENSGYFFSAAKRTENIQAFIINVKQNNTPENCVQEFKNLISTGNWNLNSSFNAILFSMLIDDCMTGTYFDDKVKAKYIPLVHEVLKQSFDDYLRTPQSPTTQAASPVKAVSVKTLDTKASDTAKAVPERTPDAKATDAPKAIPTPKKFEPNQTTYLRKLQRSPIDTPPIIHKNVYFKNASESSAFAKNHPDATVFQLSASSDNFQLFWVTSLGKKYSLVISKTLHDRLKMHLDTVSEIEAESLLNGAVRMCLLAKTNFINDVSIIIDQDPSNDFVSTFVLRGNKDVPKLFWFDNSGAQKEINLSEYPMLLSLLKVEKTWKASSRVELKTLLLTVNTRSLRPAIQLNDEFKSELMNAFGGSGADKKPVNPAYKLPTIRKRAQGQVSEVGIFAQLYKFNEPEEVAKTHSLGS